jgi:hypothetical protein
MKELLFNLDIWTVHVFKFIVTEIGIWDPRIRTQVLVVMVLHIDKSDPAGFWLISGRVALGY